MEELWDIIQVKVENGKLKEELKKLGELYRIKIGQYKECFGLKEIRKTQIEDLEKQLKKEQDKRIEVLKERNELMAEKIVIVEKLDIAESNWVDLKMKVNNLEGEWEENRTSYQRSIEDLRTQNTTLRDRLSNKDKEKETEVNLKKKEISDLQYSIIVRKGNFNNLLGDLENKKEEIKEMQKYVDEMRNRAERAERLAEELKKEKKGKNEKK